MVVLMDRFQHHDGLSGQGTPFEWQLLLDTFDQAKSVVVVNLETLHPVTPLT